MADPGPTKRRASYQDVAEAPAHKVAEIVDGELFLSPRPAGPHATVSAQIAFDLGPPFNRGNGGPGGWIILPEPELHLGDNVIVPDMAGWRKERMATVGEQTFFTLAPDWICEVLSDSTAKLDRTRKLEIYARSGVRYAWLVHPLWRSVEAARLHEGKWLWVATHVGDTTARIEPFEAIEIDLSRWWSDIGLPPPSRASDLAAEYGSP